MWLVCLVAFYVAGNAAAFFDKQPKLISESGNLVIESALDANITFRMRGRGVLLVNDFNIISHLNGNASHPMAVSEVQQLSSDLAAMRLSIAGYRNIALRVRALENGTSTPREAPVFRVRALQRRVNQIETRVERLAALLETDHCKSNPCGNGGTCESLLSTFVCRCPDNWEGATCDQDVNECAAFAGSDLGCQNGATCVNSRGSYSCNCAPNWMGIHCTRRSVDCVSSPAADLCGHGTCVQTNDAIGYKCICEQGWKTNGVTVACTVDVDECADPKPHCSMEPEVRCINLPGTYMCGLCPAGFTGNGHYCTDVNECEINNGGCSTNPSVQCVNTRGSSHCGICPMGYTGDGRVCTRIQPGVPVIGQGACAMPNFCHPLARCITGVYGVSRCECPAGYIGAGYGSFGCRPSTIDPCLVTTCFNGGTCVANGTIASCRCTNDYELPYCLTRSPSLNACASQPCQHGGTCVPASNFTYECRCPTTHTGKTCAVETTACGGVLNSPSGVLKHPIGDKYAHNTRCAWLIITNSSQVLNVTFTNFNLEPSTECRFDWLQIHDGRSSSAYPVGRFCGGALPKGGNIISTHNALYMWFRSDNTTNNDGFELSWETIAPVCGGQFEMQTHGTLSSPGAPGNYPQNRDCEWYLSAPPGKRIQLHFYTMQLETHDTCDNDFLAIYDGSSTSDTQLVRFCNTSHPEPLTSSTNELTLHFHSDGISTDAGFQIHYSVVEGVPGCGGTWTTRRGEISSPAQDGRYPRNLQCEYLIRVPVDNRIQLRFTRFHMESSGGCYSDYLQIYDGSSTRDTEVGKFCGEQIPDPYVSRSNVLLLVLKTDWSVSGEGFRVVYEEKCGNRFTNASGIITSPHYPNTYDESVNCVYEIIAPPGKAIVVDFLDFDIEDSSPQCIFDVLEVYSGHRTNDSVASSRFCGNERPPQIITDQNMVTISFISDSSIPGRGFKANYTVVDATCGGVVKELGHRIQPPSDTNDDYIRHANCTWIIVAPPNHIVQLTFESFDLEYGMPSCYFDFVRVTDGVGDGVAEIGKFCGNRIPPIIQSTMDALTIEFQSDGSIQGDGFLATYQFIDARNFCGGRFFSLSGTIRSPGWPLRYPNSRDCTWIINAPSGKQVELTVQSFELENQFQCTTYFDYVEIRNGDTTDSPLIGRYCNDNIPKTIRSHTNKLLIRFKTDSSITARGFAIDWQSALSGCGGTIRHTNKGSITSPNYPQPYEQSQHCEWRISVSQGSLIQLNFTDMNIEAHQDCVFDSVSIYDGRSAGSRPLGQFCGTNMPPQINSTSNEIFIRMTTDMSNQGRGFSLQFKAVCDRTIDDWHGVIQSPNNPHNYPNYARCAWTISVPKGNKVQLTFTQFEMEYYDNSCPFDYLEILQKDLSNTVLERKKHCETGVLPPQFISFAEVVSLIFHTDSSGTAPGFRLEYNIIGCGNLMNHPEGQILSPNFPAAYQADTHCDWGIEVPFGSLVELTIYDYDIQQTVNCTADGLLVSNEKNTSSYKPYCGRIEKPIVITANTNKLYLKFFSDHSISGRGFNASYRSVPITCGGIFKNTKGSISSPHYPANYDPETSCEWLIETQESHTLLLNFIDFSLEKYDDDCDHDYVLIIDGTDRSSDRQLAKICGNNVTPNMTFASTGNKMLVVMRSDYSIQLKGFMANFVTSCGANVVVKDSGIVNANNMGHWSTPACNWTFTAEKPDQHIQLVFLDVHMTDDCKSQILYRNGAQTYIMCHDQPHIPAVISDGQELFLSIAPAPEATSATFRFEAMYSLLENGCGNTFMAKRGKIASPKFPYTYPLNIECEWLIKASPGNQLLIEFNQLDVDSSEHCNEDYVELRNTNERGQIIGVFCGTTPPSDLKVAPGDVWMKFFSDNDGVGRGFLLEYSYAKMVDVTGSSGLISSPLYPKFDVNDDDQMYRIIVSLGQVVSVVIDDLVVRSGSILTIYDGYDDQSEIIGSYSTIPTEAVYSTTNVILIKWTVEIEGIFRLKWDEVSSAANAANSTDDTNESLNCTANSVIHLGVGRALNISSPGYPYGYAERMQCQWTIISAQMGFHPIVYFDAIDLENIADCRADFVSVSSGADMDTFKNLVTMCTTTPNVSIHTIYEGSPFLRLNFVSDLYTNRTGFNSVVRLQCGGVFTTSSGVINKTMTLSDMPGNKCEWAITVREGHTIEFTFKELKLNKDLVESVCDSYLILRNGHSKQSPFLGNGQYCGSVKPSPLRTVGHQAFVQFVGGNRSIIDDFVISFQEVSSQCGENIILPDVRNASVTIQSPNYPNIPNAFSECIWTITAPHGELLKIDFVDQFDLFISTPCEQEFVELRDGATASSHLMGTFCDQIPSTHFTTSNVLRIRYMTEINVPKNGFRARISVSNCGGYYRGSRGLISSPNFSGAGAYPRNSICDYRIFAKVGSTVNLTFLNIDLPESDGWYSYEDDDCSTVDHVEIHNIYPSENSDPNENSTQMSSLGVFCGTSVPDSIITEGMEILVRFVTHGANEKYKGFRLSFNSSIEKCGGDINAASGIISSPGYPIGRTMRQFCEWRITVPKGRRVRAEMMDFDLLVFDPTPTLVNGQVRALSFSQRLTFYNDMAYGTRITILTGSDTPVPIYSSDNMMLINMWMRSNTGHRGFRLNFTSSEPTICVGDFNELQGSIQTPVNQSFTCNYRRENARPFFVGPSGGGFGTLALRINTIENTFLPLAVPCTPGINLPIKITNRDTIFVKRKCLNGSENIFDYATPFTNTQLQVRLNPWIQSVRIDYKLHPCGEEIANTTDYTIIPVAMDTNYGAVHCVWHYSAKPGMKITVTMDFSQLDCQKEFVNIYNGGAHDSPMVERVCGIEADKRNFTAALSGNQVRIEYHSQQYNPATRYAIRIAATYDLCGGLLVAPYFRFGNPQNGTKYPNNVECIWEIRARPGYHIGLSFVDRFFVEQSSNCSKDFVAVYDKINDDYTALGQICGRTIENHFNSSAGEMRVMFRTNSEITGDGFTAVWTENCGGTYAATKTAKTIVSPRYPNNYPSNAVCNYTITAPTDSFINLRFDDFELEETSRGCIYDNLTVYRQDDWSPTMSLIGSYCRKDALKTLRYKNKITLIFRTDQWLEKRGFRLHYSVDNCGGDIHATTQVRVPINAETHTYLEELRCVWNITAPDDKHIVVRFETIELEQNDYCYLDFVEVYEGHQMDADHRKAHLCGNLTSHTPIVNINANKAIMRFQSDTTMSVGGFAALILFVPKCDRNIELTAQLDTYHLDETSTGYQDMLDCHYKVTGPDGWVVRMEFTEFHLAPCAPRANVSLMPCDCDFVEVRDGGGPYAERIGTNRCGHELPRPVTSTNTALWVRMATDSAIQSTGFKATFTLQRSACGPHRIELNATALPQYTLSYPLQSGKYRPNERCTWELAAPSGYQLMLSFDRLDTQPNSPAETIGCDHDYIEVVDSAVNPYIVEGLGASTVFSGVKSSQLKPTFYQNQHFASAPHMFCGAGKPNEFYSSESKVLIKFRSDDSDERTGFAITAKLLEACHRNYTSLEGRIVSNSLETCDTHITVPANYTIALFFGRFNIYPNIYPFVCSDTNKPLAIYDGNQLAISHCAQSVPPPFFSNTSHVTLKFQKLDISTWGGSIYDITYVATDKGRGCGGDIFNYGGEFSSPLYPSTERNNVDCRWTIEVPMNLVVSLKFTVWDMGPRSTCANNFIQLLEPNGAEEEVVKRTFCADDKPGVFVAKSHRLILRFKKTVNFAGTGWVANFMSVQPNALPSEF